MLEVLDELLLFEELAELLIEELLLKELLLFVDELLLSLLLTVDEIVLLVFSPLDELTELVFLEVVGLLRQLLNIKAKAVRIMGILLFFIVRILYTNIRHKKRLLYCITVYFFSNNDYSPDTAIFLINTDSADTPDGETVTSLPTSKTSLKISNKLPEIVIKSNGLPFLPFSIMKPVD